MKVGQFIEYNKRIILFFRHAKNETGRLVPDMNYFLQVFSNVMTRSIVNCFGSI